MTVTDVVPDRDAHTLRLAAEYRAPVEQVWQLWADPRLLERWWGPPTYPATVHQHDLRAGGRVLYSMTGPEGDVYHGWWQVVSVDARTRLEFDDGFGDAEGKPAEGMPVSRGVVEISDAGDGVTRMVITTAFASLEDMDKLLAMGMQEGIVAALGQTDALLAEGALR